MSTRLKAEGVPYEDRIGRLDEVTYPKTGAEVIYATFFVDDQQCAHEEITVRELLV